MIERKHAFSLPEVAVGIFIFGIISVFFFTAIQHTSKDVRFAAEHFTGYFLGQKVAEDIAQETIINPHAFDSLGINSTKPQLTQITGGFLLNCNFSSQKIVEIAKTRAIIEQKKISTTPPASGGFFCFGSDAKSYV